MSSFINTCSRHNHICDKREKYDIDDFHAFQESEPAKSISSRLRRHSRAQTTCRNQSTHRCLEFKHGGPISQMVRIPRNTAIMKNTTPVWTNLQTAWCQTQLIAFGGVATRSTKAKEHTHVAGISTVSGCVSADRATAVIDAMSVSPHGERGFADTFRDGSINTNEEIDSPISLLFCLWPRDHDLC